MNCFYILNDTASVGCQRWVENLQINRNPFIPQSIGPREKTCGYKICREVTENYNVEVSFAELLFQP